jgi:uncharacterized protein
MVHANRHRPLVPTFGLTLDGKPMTKDMVPWVASLSIHDQINLPGMFDLQLVGRDSHAHAPQWVDDDRLKLGARIELSLGYGARLDTMIVGEITDLEPGFNMSGPPQLVVRGQDRRHRLNGAPQTRSFEGFTDSQIVQLIVSSVVSPDITIDPTDSGVMHEHRSQNEETDLAFVQKIAARIGYEMVMENAQLLLFRPRANAGAAVATLTLDDDLFDFRPYMTLLPVTNVTSVGWNTQEKDKLDSPAEAGRSMGATSGTEQARIVLGGAVDMMVREYVTSQAELDQLSAARLNDKTLDFIRGTGRCRGRTDVRAGKVIHIDKIGKRFSGPYYVTSAAHTYTPGEGYITSFNVRRNAS